MSFNNEEDKVNWMYKKQIERLYDKKKYKAANKAKLDKRLFNYSLNLSLTDWKLIRKGDFWDKHDQLPTEHERNEFILSRVLKYFKT